MVLNPRSPTSALLNERIFLLEHRYEDPRAKVSFPPGKSKASAVSVVHTW